MKTNSQIPYLLIEISKRLKCVITMCLLSYITNCLYAQPAKIWEGSYAYNDLDPEQEDWIYDVITSSDCNNYFFCGFSEVDEVRIPSIGKVNAITGEKQWIHLYDMGYDISYGHLQKISEVIEGGIKYYIATGSIEDQGSPAIPFKTLMVKIDEDGNLVSGFPKLFDSPNAKSAVRMITNAPVIDNGTATFMVLAGRDNAAVTGQTRGVISLYDLDGNLITDFASGGTFTKDALSVYTKVAIEYDNGTPIAIFAIGDLMIDPWTGGDTQNLDVDHDVLVTKLSMSGVLLEEIVFSEADLAGDYIDINSGSETLLCDVYPADATDGDSENEWQRGVSILIDGDIVYLGCFFDTHLYNDCAPLSDFGAYLEVDYAIIAIHDDLDLHDLLWTKNVDRFIAIDFEVELVKTGDNIAVAGGHTSFDNSEITSIESSLSIVSAASGNILSQRLVRDDHPVNCGFATTTNCNGDIILGGNNGTPISDPESTEDYYLIGVQNPCASLVEYDIENGHIVSSTTNWTTNKKVKGKIRVPSGTTLNITNATIEFACTQHLVDFDVLSQNLSNTPVTKIIVEAGGTLNITNSTLRGLDACGRDWMWEGIVVLGPDYSQEIPGTPGRVNIDGSTIQDARLGILASQGYYNSDGNFTPLETRGGATIIASNDSHFDNNRRDVHFAPDLYNLNGSSFTETSFTCTGPLKDIFYRFPDGRGKGTSQFVSIYNASPISFNNCIFSNSGEFTGTDRGLGIVSFNSSYKVKNESQFLDLDKGIVAGGVNPLYKISVDDNCTFTNCQYGIHIKGGAFHHFAGNNFNLISEAQDAPVPIVTGIRLEGVSNSIVEYNDFVGTNDFGQYGIINENSGDNASYIFDNYFNELFVGIQTQSDNDGLQMRCNQHLINEYAWAISPQNIGTLPDQGNCGPSAKQAGNQFQDATCSNEYSHIFSTVEFDYNFREGETYEEPECITLEVNKNSCGILNQNGISCNQRSAITPGNVVTLTNTARMTADRFERELIRTDIIRYHLDNNHIDSALIMMSLDTFDHWKRLRALSILYSNFPTSAASIAASRVVNDGENSAYDTLWTELYYLYDHDQTFKDLTLGNYIHYWTKTYNLLIVNHLRTYDNVN